jgi:hypothetical protein
LTTIIGFNVFHALIEEQKPEVAKRESECGKDWKDL